jgi:hypothetical protein
MKKNSGQRSFYEDESAVSEEFTSLPALAVVMIGITLFILLVANVYSAYEARVDSLKKYQTADFIATKLTNTECPFIQEAGIVDLTKFESVAVETYVHVLQQQYTESGIDFKLKLRWGTESAEIVGLSTPQGNQVAVSRDISIKLNDAQTVLGKLTIITWSV